MPAANSAVPCSPRPAIARGGSEATDPDELTARQIAAADRMLRTAEREQSRGGPTDVHHVVAVHVHVLRTPSTGAVPHRRIATQIAVLNDAFAGGQAGAAAHAPFRFTLRSTDVTTRTSWYRMSEGTKAERQAKRHLHRGAGNDLNLYIGSNSTQVLGWATQPTRLDQEPWMDGVVIARHTMPDGAGGHYSAGDAAVHETGHWLGLFHTFAGKCGRRGDLVADTPAEGKPSYTCPTRRDTCTAAGKDPVRNFMDYSYDSCMDRFSRGQVQRMKRAWAAFRSPSSFAGGAR